jgi:arylsulfatase A-like enzyme
MISLLVWSGTGCRQEGSGRCVILIVLDAARADRFSCYGYPRSTTPNIDALGGAVFLNHFVQRTHTRSTLPTILFSRYFTVQLFPASPVLPLTHPSDLFIALDEQAISLPAALSREGFISAAISTHRWLRQGTRFAAELDELYDVSRLVDEHKHVKHKAPAAIDRAISWLSDNRHRDRFLYLHLMDTHFPHYFEQDAAELFGASSFSADRFDSVGRPKDLHVELTADERRYLDALYDGSLRFTDRHLGRLISYLEEDGQLADTLLVITSDHGEHLLERPGLFEHGGSWYDTLVHVPLIISYPPKLPAGRYQLLSEGVDILPTVLSLLDLPLAPGKEVDGTDLLALVNGRIPHRRHVIGGQSDHDGAVRSTEYKAMFDDLEQIILADQAPAPTSVQGRLFDLRTDPLEVDNLWSRRPEVASELLEEYRRLAAHSYRRHLASVTDEQPLETFAIALREMAKDRKPEPVKIFSELDLRAAPAHWMESVFGVHFGLLGMPSAPSLTTGVRVPNGSYRISLVMAGQCSVSLDRDGDEYHLRAHPFNPQRPTDLSLEAVGPVEVTDQWFSASLTPGPANSCFVRCFAFQPVRPGQAPPPVVDEDDTEILKALGYI